MANFTAAYSNAVQYGVAPFQFVTGFGIENSPFYPNTQLVVFYGSTLDSTNTYQLSMNPTVLIVDLTITGISSNGIGGIDNGIRLPNKVYGVYVAWDSVGTNPVSAFLSSSYYHPLNPVGYNANKLIGYVATDGSSNFRPGGWTPYGSTAYRNMRYTPNVVVLENGTADVETDVNLISYIPNITWQIANLQFSFTSTTPGNALTIYSGESEYNLYAQVAGVPVTSMTNLVGTNQIMSDGVVIPRFGYSVTNSGTDSATIHCNGYDFFL